MESTRNQTIQTPKKAKDETLRGGKRKGAGRPIGIKNKEVKEKDFTKAFKQMKSIIYALKRQKWSVISRKQVIQQLQKIVDIAATQ